MVRVSICHSGAYPLIYSYLETLASQIWYSSSCLTLAKLFELRHEKTCFCTCENKSAVNFVNSSLIVNRSIPLLTSRHHLDFDIIIFRVAMRQGKVREIEIFSRSGNCQGIV